MPDWKQIVRQHVTSVGREIGPEVVAELAAHLEDVHDHTRLQGLNEVTATGFALQEAGDWRDLAVRINNARSRGNLMNQRTQTFWLPAVLSLLGASVLLMLLERLGLQPRLVWVGGFAISLYWQWLVSLPIFGAIGAHLSQRAHGSISSRLAAALAPALVMLVVMSLILPWGLAIDGFHFLRFVAFGVGLTNWVAIPALALAIGAAPFLKGSSLRRA